MSSPQYLDFSRLKHKKPITVPAFSDGIPEDCQIFLYIQLSALTPENARQPLADVYWAMETRDEAADENTPPELQQDEDDENPEKDPRKLDPITLDVIGTKLEIDFAPYLRSTDPQGRLDESTTLRGLSQAEVIALLDATYTLTSRLCLTKVAKAEAGQVQDMLEKAIAYREKLAAVREAPPPPSPNP